MKRRLTYASTLFALALVALAAWLYVPTRNALQRAESLQFRRMLVAKLDEHEAYRFFYATNRRLEPGEGELAQRLGSRRGETLSFGHFDTEIEPALGIGMIINPTDWFQNEEIRLRDVRALDEDVFVEQVRGLVQRSPFQSLLVVVHGFREAFPSALRKTAFLAHVLDIDSPVLLFDWPGNQGSSLRGYRRAQRLAESSGADLAASLELVLEDVQPERLWLVANSMGAQVVVDALNVLHQAAAFADPDVEIENVVLTAPDVGYGELNRRFKEEIGALVGTLTVYVSSNDRALLVSRLINRERRAGESTVNIGNPDQLESALSVAGLIDPGSDRITLVDVTPVNRTRNFHNFSLETPEFFDDLFLRLVNPEPPLSRQQHKIRTPEGKVYWVLTRN